MKNCDPRKYNRKNPIYMLFSENFRLYGNPLYGNRCLFPRQFVLYIANGVTTPSLTRIAILEIKLQGRLETYRQ